MYASCSLYNRCVPSRLVLAACCSGVQRSGNCWAHDMCWLAVKWMSMPAPRGTCIPPRVPDTVEAFLACFELLPAQAA